jgi:predicted MFS family arabinose efflux permease
VTGWIAVERRAASPMFDLRLLAKPAIWRSYVVTFAVCVGAALSIYLVPQLFAVSGDGYGFGASSTDTGRYLLPAAAMAAISGPLGGLGTRRFGSTAVVAAGIGLMTASLIGMAFVHTEIWHLIAGKALISLANGACITALVIKTATSVDQGTTGTATSLVLVIRVLGFATGAQIGGAVLTAGTPAGSDVPAESAYVTALVIASVVTALSLLAIRTMNKGAKA